MAAAFSERLFVRVAVVFVAGVVVVVVVCANANATVFSCNINV